MYIIQCILRMILHVHNYNYVVEIYNYALIRVIGTWGMDPPPPHFLGGGGVYSPNSLEKGLKKF